MHDILNQDKAASVSCLPEASEWGAEEGEGQAENDRLVLGGKTFERLTQCLMAAMDRTPTEFALYLPHFVPLYSDNTLLLADVATVHRMRAKRRVLLMRFLARALLCPVYQVDWLKAQFEGQWRPCFPQAALVSSPRSAFLFLASFLQRLCWQCAIICAPCSLIKRRS